MSGILISNDEAQLAADALSREAANLRDRYEYHLALYQKNPHDAHREAAQALSDDFQVTSAAARAIRQAIERNANG